MHYHASPFRHPASHPAPAIRLSTIIIVQGSDQIRSVRSVSLFLRFTSDNLSLVINIIILSFFLGLSPEIINSNSFQPGNPRTDTAGRTFRAKRLRSAPLTSTAHLSYIDCVVPSFSPPLRPRHLHSNQLPCSNGVSVPTTTTAFLGIADSFLSSLHGLTRFCAAPRDRPLSRCATQCGGPPCESVARGTKHKPGSFTKDTALQLPVSFQPYIFPSLIGADLQYLPGLTPVRSTVY